MEVSIIFDINLQSFFVSCWFSDSEYIDNVPIIVELKRIFSPIVSLVPLTFPTSIIVLLLSVNLIGILYIS